MANLSAHAQAAECLSVAFAAQADQSNDPDRHAMLTDIGKAYARAASLMRDANQAEAMATPSGCTFDHSKMTGPCPACKARA